MKKTVNLLQVRQKYLAQYPELNTLVPAVVTEVKEKEATAALQNGQTVIIPWEGLSWARPALKKVG